MKFIFYISFVMLTVILTLIFMNMDRAPIKGTRNYENDQFAITINVYDTEEDLNEVIDNIYDNISGASSKSFSVWEISENTYMLSDCTMFVVRPKSRSDNYAFKTWGKELARCVYGTYDDR